MSMRLLVRGKVLLLKYSFINPHVIETYKLVKVLDTATVLNVSQNWEEPTNIEPEIQKELSDFFHFDTVIIPYFSQNRCLIVIVENQLDVREDRIVVTLYDRKRDIEGEGDGQFEDISNIVHAIIWVVLGGEEGHGYEDKIEGWAETIEVADEADMIPSILQIAESHLMHKARFPMESFEEYRHKILDRLLAFKQL